MTGALASALVAVGGVLGLFLVFQGLRRRVSWGGGRRPPARIEVLGRAGLSSNQGLAIVRVGRRLLLVSSGEGGARALVELTEDDLALQDDPAPASARPGSAEAARLPRGWSLRAGRIGLWAVLGFLLVAPSMASAQVGGAPPSGATEPGIGLLGGLPPVSVQLGSEEEGVRLTGTVGTVVVLGVLAMAPTLLLLTTSFTRILVVLFLLRQALGTQNTPPAHLLTGLALLLSGVVMAPTLDQVRTAAIDPWLAGQIDEGTMLQAASGPMRSFMLEHARETDLRTFLEISRSEPPETPQDVSSTVLMSAFVTSELRAAFEIGFALFLPFVVIDIVVAAILTSMGMFMLPPTMIALPCKLLVFVLMDGWSLVLGALAEGYV